MHVKMIYNTQDKPVVYATAGENIKIQVKIKESYVSRGCMITDRKNTCHICYEFLAKLKCLVLPPENPVLSAGSKGLVLHIHTAKEEV